MGIPLRTLVSGTEPSESVDTREGTRSTESVFWTAIPGAIEATLRERYHRARRGPLPEVFA